MPEKIRIKSYSKFFKYEKRIYSFGNWILPVPLIVVDIVYFILGLIMMSVLITLIPAMNGIPWALKYVGAPIGFMRFFRTAKLDGKNPAFYVVDMLRYWLYDQGQYIECFKVYPRKNKGEAIRWKIIRSGGDNSNV